MMRCWLVFLFAYVFGAWSIVDDSTPRTITWCLVVLCGIGTLIYLLVAGLLAVL